VVCTFGDVANGAAMTVSLQVLAKAVGSFTNSAAVSGDRDLNPTNNTAAATTTVNGCHRRSRETISTRNWAGVEPGSTTWGDRSARHDLDER
jgi:hypothetical protein